MDVISKLNWLGHQTFLVRKGGGHAGMGQAFDDFSWYLRRAFNSSINRGVRAI